MGYRVIVRSIYMGGSRIFPGGGEELTKFLCFDEFALKILWPPF